MMQIKITATLICLFCFASIADAKQSIRVTFVSCCLREGFFWPQVESFMHAAADDLNINLTVVYSDMNHIRMKELAEDVANREDPPDYLIIDNYKLMAGYGRLLDLLGSDQVKVM